MQFQFAYAAVSTASDGGASIGSAATAAAAPADESTIVNIMHAAHCAARVVPFDKDNQNGLPAALRFTKDAWLSGAAMVATITRHKRVRSGTHMGGGTISASVWPTRLVALEIGAKILAGDGVRAGRVMDPTLRAAGHRAFPQVASRPVERRLDADFASDREGRSGTPARSNVPLASKAVCAAAGAMKRAASLDASAMPYVMPSARVSVSVAQVAYGTGGGSSSGAITLHDFKDSEDTVLDAVNV